MGSEEKEEEKQQQEQRQEKLCQSQPSDDDNGNNNFAKSFVIYAWQTVLKVNSPGSSSASSPDSAHFDGGIEHEHDKPRRGRER